MYISDTLEIVLTNKLYPGSSLAHCLGSVSASRHSCRLGVSKGQLGGKRGIRISTASQFWTRSCRPAFRVIPQRLDKADTGGPQPRSLCLSFSFSISLALSVSAPVPLSPGTCLSNKGQGYPGTFTQQNAGTAEKEEYNWDPNACGMCGRGTEL